MSFSTFRTPPRSPWAPARHSWWRWAAAAGLALSACGGGTSQYEAFIPERVLVVGDELSLLESDGKKYAVNGLKADKVTRDCAAEPLWVQTVASAYGYVFKECNPDNSTAVNAIMRAGKGATVADLTAQVDAQLAAGGFRDKDLVLALAGTNDLLELYSRFDLGQASAAAIEAEARVRGERMAALVNRLVDLKAKVIVSTLPDLGLSPFAQAEEVAHPGTGRAALLSSLTSLFNERLGVKVLLDGRYVGLMQSDLRSQLAARFPASYALANANADVCKKESTKPDWVCTTETLVDGATSGSYFWAGDNWLSSGGHSQLASLALDRATRNPF